ncbi:MAG: four helix bundle protein [Patescibacteria group bacterium]
MVKINSYKDLIVWQRSMQLVENIYKITEKFPKEEIYGLTAQMRRSAVSIPSNIAEGSCRGTRKDYAQFLRMAYGSGAELETQIEIAKRLLGKQKIDYSDVDKFLDEVMKMLNSLIKRLTTNI